MDLQDLNNKVKAMTDTKAMEIAMFKYLKANPQKILFYQKQQLFRDSVDSNNVNLGYYGPNSENYNSNKTEGSKFTMINSGSFRSGLFVNVEYRKIIIGSSSPNLINMYNNESFDTTDFFGLTDDSTRRFMNNVIIPFIRKWKREQFNK